MRLLCLFMKQVDFFMSDLCLLVRHLGDTSAPIWMKCLLQRQLWPIMPLKSCFSQNLSLHTSKAHFVRNKVWGEAYPQVVTAWCDVTRWEIAKISAFEMYLGSAVAISPLGWSGGVSMEIWNVWGDERLPRGSGHQETSWAYPITWMFNQAVPKLSEG